MVVIFKKNIQFQFQMFFFLISRIFPNLYFFPGLFQAWKFILSFSRLSRVRGNPELLAIPSEIIGDRLLLDKNSVKNITTLDELKSAQKLKSVNSEFFAVFRIESKLRLHRKEENNCSKKPYIRTKKLRTLRVTFLLCTI